MTEDVIKTDAVIIGAGPVGIFAVFELGLVDIKCPCDRHPRPAPAGNAPSSIRRSRSTTFRASPSSPARSLPTSLWTRSSPSAPTSISVSASRAWSGSTAVSAHDGHRHGVRSKVVVIAAGGGSFTPKRPPLPGIEQYEGNSVFYSVRKMEQLPRPRRADRGRRRFRARLDLESSAGGEVDHASASARRVQGGARLGAEDVRAGREAATSTSSSGK